MSVIVKGMEMPVNCFRCSLDSGVWKPEQGPFILCRYTKGKVDYDDVPTDRRLPCCGLKELPEKHGRLIDADEFDADYEALYKLNDITNGEWFLFREWLKNQKTIVEAEGE